MKMNLTFSKTHMNKHLLKAENCCTFGHYQNPLLQRQDKYQWYLNTHEENLDLCIHQNSYKDYNEKIHKLDLHVRNWKRATRTQPNFHQFSVPGKRLIRWEKAKRFLGCEISEEKSIIHFIAIYLVPTISTKERYRGKQTIRGPCGHGNRMLVKQTTTVIWNLSPSFTTTWLCKHGQAT